MSLCINCSDKSVIFNITRTPVFTGIEYPMSSKHLNIVCAKSAHLDTLKAWFPDRQSAYNWGGPGLRYPFSDETFLEDIHWDDMPSYSMIDEKENLLGFGQYYEKAGRCHLARLVIAPSHRSTGMGCDFISRLMKIGMASLRVNECSLFVIRFNTTAVKCYGKLNFQKTAYPKGHDQYKDIDFMVFKDA
jgi:ribosomal protein S18 acetylase RimI-like enzyme